MASHAGIFRGARLSSRDERQAPLKTPASGASKRRNVQHFEMSVSIKIIPLLSPLLPKTKFTSEKF